MFSKLLEKWKREYIEGNKQNWQDDYILDNEELFRKAAEQKFIGERYNEIYELREAIVFVMQNMRPSLPGAVFALKLITDELLQRENDYILGKLPKPIDAGEAPKIVMGNIKDLAKNREENAKGPLKSVSLRDKAPKPVKPGKK